MVRIFACVLVERSRIFEALEVEDVSGVGGIDVNLRASGVIDVQSLLVCGASEVWSVWGSSGLDLLGLGVV